MTSDCVFNLLSLVFDIFKLDDSDVLLGSSLKHFDELAHEIEDNQRGGRCHTDLDCGSDATKLRDNIDDGEVFVSEDSDVPVEVNSYKDLEFALIVQDLFQFLCLCDFFFRSYGDSGVSLIDVSDSNTEDLLLRVLMLSYLYLFNYIGIQAGLLDLTQANLVS